MQKAYASFQLITTLRKKQHGTGGSSNTKSTITSLWNVSPYCNSHSERQKRYEQRYHAEKGHNVLQRLWSTLYDESRLLSKWPQFVPPHPSHQLR